MTPPQRIRMWSMIVGVLLLAGLLRAAYLAALPPGVIHDEVWNWLTDQSILQGDLRPIYDRGGGREGLYFMAQALSVRTLGDNLIAMRLPSVLVSMGLVAATYSIGRRWFGPGVGLVSMSLVTISAWVVLFGRLAVRISSMPFVTALALYWLYRALHMPAVKSRRTFVAVGILLGLTWYTYPSSWGLPFVLVPLTLYLFLFERDRLRERWRGMAIALGLWIAGGVLLFAYIGSHPSVFGRVQQVNQPLEALLAGDIRPLLANIPLVLQTFTILGDHGLEYNIQWRPIFPEPLTAGLFYLGLGLIVWRTLRRGRGDRLPYLLLLLWLFASLVPAFPTSDPLNAPRLIGLAGPTFLVAGLGAQSLWSFFRAQWGRRGDRLMMGLLGVTLALNLYLTVRDLIAWNANPVVRFLYQSDTFDIARALDASLETTPVAIGGLTPDVIDPATMRIFLAREDLPLRFFGGANELDPLLHGVVLPPGDDVRVYVPGVVSLRPELIDFLDGWGERTKTETFTLWHGATPSIQREPLARSEFADLLSVTWKSAPNESAQPWLVHTQWRVHGPSVDPLRIFIHLVDSSGNILAQYDGLQVPSTQWMADDRIWHWHALALPDTLPAGNYMLRVGLYRPPDGPRVMFDGEREFIELPVVRDD